MLQYFPRCQLQHERVRKAAAIATRLAAAEILAGVRRWGFESDAAAMAAEAETICFVKAPAWRRECAWFVRVAQERVAEATGRRLQQGEGRRTRGHTLQHWVALGPGTSNQRQTAGKAMLGTVEGAGLGLGRDADTAKKPWTEGKLEQGHLQGENRKKGLDGGSKSTSRSSIIKRSNS